MKIDHTPYKHIPAPEKLADEVKTIKTLTQYLKKANLNTDTITNSATQYIQAIRAQTQPTTKTIINHYGLDTPEGQILMQLAETLPRIPDKKTARTFLNDRLATIETITSKTTSLTTKTTDFLLNIASILGKYNLKTSLTSAVTTPIMHTTIKHILNTISEQYILASTIEAATQKTLSDYRYSYDILGEGSRTASQADIYFSTYMEALHHTGKQNQSIENPYEKDSISIKLSALHPRLELAKYPSLISELIPKLEEIINTAKEYSLLITIDAEESYRLDLTLLLFTDLLKSTQYPHLGLAIQAYNPRCFYIIDYLIHLAQQYQHKIPVRLVKGAYWDSEIKHAQTEGLSYYPVFTEKHHTDISFLACAHKLIKNHRHLYPQLATHNAYTIACVEPWLSPHIDYEFQRLHGMGKRLHDQLTNRHPCRVYAPIGSHETLLPYLIRRLLENGAGNAFVKQLADPGTPIETLIQTPLTIDNTQPIPLPQHLYSNRQNSTGIELNNTHNHNTLTTLLENPPTLKTKAQNTATIDTTIQTANNYFPIWNHTPIKTRAQYLLNAASLLEKYQNEALTLCIQEAHKTIKNSIGEIRETIDFLRYYATEGIRLLESPQLPNSPTGETNTLSLSGRGTFITISPWNFPLAIFTGQIAAALITGNTVIAKPAEDTPTIANWMIQLLHKAGIPKKALHCIQGDGSTGQQLIKHPTIAGVTFTGSTQTAHNINQTLAKKNGPIIPFIAETGGQNCMIADNSIMLEHTLDDILLSAFDSAGQRCSALRVLFLQEEIAATLIPMLSEAIQTLKLGNPKHLSTDIGPVINQQAYDTIQQHIKHLSKTATLIAHGPHTEEKGYFIPPHIFRINHIAELKQEIFGPILHIITFKQDEIEQAIEQINSTGYGLTFGIQSRIHSRINTILPKINAGNYYINRPMIGATVGVQPFGGQGLSGTGPKAGGPHYLLRFLTEKTTSENTTAFGGNIELLK